MSDVLQGPQQERLLEILRHRFSHALIDEFQDTDARQWLIFRRVFVEDSEGCLYVIGDPKQAIYGFRGADIHTYMSARDTLLSCPETPHKPISLTTNFRSTQPLIRSVNLLLEQKADAPFLSGDIQYTHPVSCGRPELKLKTIRGLVPRHPITVHA